MASGMRYRRRSRSEWQYLLGRQRESGLRPPEFCRREGLRLGTFRWWQHELRRAPGHAMAVGDTSERASFVPVAVRPVAEVSREAGAIEILIQGEERRARIAGDCPLGLAVAIAEALRGGRPCS